MIERWIIEGDLTTRSSLWIRSGEVRQGDPRARRRDAESKDGRSADVLACVLDDCKNPYLPGSALKGAVRAWLRAARPEGAAIERIFGGERKAGVALFFDAPLDVERSPVPPALMGSTSHSSERKTVLEPGIAIDRITRTAAEGALFWQETVLPGSVFKIRIQCERATKDDVALLVQVLKGFVDHGGIRLGGAVASGFGCLSGSGWTVRRLAQAGIERWLADAARGHIRSWQEYCHEENDLPAPTAEIAADRQRLPISLRFDGPFLVNDPSRTKATAKNDKDNKKEENDQSSSKQGLPDFAPRLDAEGRISLPGRSFRGALRSQAERILRTLGHVCPGAASGQRCPPVRNTEDVEKLCIACRVFGAPGWRSPIRFSDFSALPPHPAKLPRQQFVAIDRFTGGAARGKLFDAERPDSVTLCGSIEIESERMCLWGYGLLALVLRDLAEGDIQFGLGRAKGYGSCAIEHIEMSRFAWAFIERVSGSTAEKAVAELQAKVGYVQPPVLSAVPNADDPAGRGEPPAERSDPSDKKLFLNPYHFIPLATPDVAGWHTARRPDADSELSHAHYAPGTHSGRIVCRLTTCTPLVIGGRNDRNDAAVADAGSGEEQSRAAQPTSVKFFELEESPAIPASSLRGMFSSLFEAATGSALRVLDNPPLAFRKLAERGIVLRKLGMLVRSGTGYRLIEISDFEISARKPVRIEYSRFRGKRSFSLRNPEFYYLSEKARSRDPADGLEQGETWNAEDPKCSFKKGIGILYLLLGLEPGKMPRPKKYELFLPLDKPQYGVFRAGGVSGLVTLEVLPEAVERFQDLAEELFIPKKDKGLPYTPVGRPRDPKKPVRLAHGDIVYYGTNGGNQVIEISFSAIWRRPVEMQGEHGKKTVRVHDFFQRSPELLPFGPERRRLSPAEVLFGFVSEGQGKPLCPAYASRIRFGFGRIAPYPSGSQTDGNQGYYLAPVVLKQLASPKLPSPAMYFKHQNLTGDPVKKIEKTDLSPNLHSPQGRKYYLHDPGIVKRPTFASDKPSRMKELAGKPSPTYAEREEIEQRKKEIQNHLEVRPLPIGTVFHFHVDFDNLTDDELAALCFALSPSPEFHHKLGLGKPLGLGSIKVEPLGAFFVKRARRYGDESALSGVRYHRAWYASGTEPWPERYSQEHPDRLAEAKRECDLYFDAMRDAFAKELESSHPEIARAIALLGTFDTRDDIPKLRVHYPPQSGKTGTLEEDNLYEWFVGNDKGTMTGPDGKYDVTSNTKKQSLKPIAKADEIRPLQQHTWDRPIGPPRNRGRQRR